jgi:RNA polymerase sigma-70 factor (ECF subfamily)
VSTDHERRARFERVAGEVYEPLQRYLRRRATADDAADVLADTLLVVWRRLDAVPDEPLPWCYGAARRCLANHRRGDSRRLRLVDRAGANLDHQAGDRLDPQTAIDASDPDLIDALSTLSHAEVEIVHLWAWEQLEPRQIAEALEATPNAVSVALTRAKRKLAARLDRQDPPTGGHLQVDGHTEQEGAGR